MTALSSSEISPPSGETCVIQRWESKDPTREVTSAAEEPRPVLLVAGIGRGRGVNGGRWGRDDIRVGRESDVSLRIKVCQSIFALKKKEEFIRTCSR